MEHPNLNLPLTITPVINGKKEEPCQTTQPDLTFHCMCCRAFFDNPRNLYQHMNSCHLGVQLKAEDFDDQDEEMSESEGEPFDYSKVMEPICDLIDLNDDSDHDDEDDDDEDDDDDDDEDDDDDDDEDEDEEHEGMEVVTSSNYTAMEADENSSSSLINMPMKEESIAIMAIKNEGRKSYNISADQMAQLGGMSFQCSHCEASFPNAGDLAKHVRSHITNKPFQCSICEKTFTHIGSLNTHIRIHSGEKPYKCELCPKAFTQSSSLMVHIRSHSVKKPHQCHLCDKGFVNSSSLFLHIKSHTGDETHPCPECDKVFKQSSLLSEHMRLHSYDLVYQCSICRSAYKSSSELVQHMKAHMGEKPFTCSICERSFTQSGSLNIHMRIHTGEKPFQCKICEKSFTQASSLTVHMKVHSIQKTHAQQSHNNRRAHVPTVSKSADETLLCIVCGSVHKDTASLANHVTHVHSELLDNIRRHDIPMQVRKFK